MDSDELDRVPLMQNEDSEEHTLWERKSKPFLLHYITLIARLWGLATIAGTTLKTYNLLSIIVTFYSRIFNFSFYK